MNKIIHQDVPDFEKIKWKCMCCNQERTDKFIKVNTFDVSHIYNHPPGVFFINIKYCVDVPSCQQKSNDRVWVIKNFFPGELNDKNKF